MDDDTGPAMTLDELRALHPPPWRIDPLSGIDGEIGVFCRHPKLGRFPADDVAAAHAGILLRESMR